MATRALVDEFMALKDLALVRSSKNAPVFGFRIDKELTKRRYSVRLAHLDDDDSFAALKEQTPEGAIVAVQPAQCEDAVRRLDEAGVKKVWIQEDCQSAAAIAYCEEHGISAVHHECVMMFAQPVKGIHAFHRWIWKLLKKLPE